MFSEEMIEQFRKYIGPSDEQMFEEWLVENTEKCKDFYLYVPHHKYPYSKDQLREMYNKIANRTKNGASQRS